MIFTIYYLVVMGRTALMLQSVCRETPEVLNEARIDACIMQVSEVTDDVRSLAGTRSGSSFAAIYEHMYTAMDPLTLCGLEVCCVLLLLIWMEPVRKRKFSPVWTLRFDFSLQGKYTFL